MALPGSEEPRIQLCIRDTKRPENTFCLRSLGKARKKTENKDKNAASFSWKHSYTQTARPCVLRAPARCTWRSATSSRLGKEQHEEGPW